MNKIQQIYLLVIFLITFSSGIFLIYQGSNSLLTDTFCKDNKNEYAFIKCPKIITDSEDEVIPTPIASAGIKGESTSSAIFTPNAFVTKVVDGDTIEADLEGEIVRVRYLGADTPETVDPRKPVQCFGKRASDENKKLVEGKSVLLTKDVSEVDKYNRLLRHVYVLGENGSVIFVNDYLIRNGFAKVLTIPPDVKFQEQFLEAQLQARQNKLGLWNEC
jgi:endonuclease YncB( thermonuclease family)